MLGSIMVGKNPLPGTTSATPPSKSVVFDVRCGASACIFSKFFWPAGLSSTLSICVHKNVFENNKILRCYKATYQDN